MQAGWCALCGHEGREEFAWKRANPELVRVTRRSDALLRFVMCARCGHVYQHPMLDADELATLYEPSCVPRWDEHPPDPHELRLWGEWVLHSVPIPRHGAILADFGGGEGPHVEPFRAAGWRITPLTMPLGDASPDAGEIVSVVLMPHTLERLTDPVTVLKAIRKQLPPDGMLALVTADLLSPSVPAHEAQPWLSDSHVRLYSFNSVQTVLTHAGFRPESVRRVAGTGAVAVLASPDEHVVDAEPDDPMSLQELFHAVRHPGAADTLGHNLAALAETQPGVLPALCRKMDTGRYSVRRSGSCLVAVVARLGDLPGEEELPVIHWGDIDGLLEPPQFDASSPQTLVQLGLGSGELATALAEQLHAG
ncbi:MAG TPA: methyltransferase domain-containing protein, partial [Nitrospirales bacterium]|nr:methyltransferase domain-containing protein [Nitrospirales bacterium]